MKNKTNSNSQKRNPNKKRSSISNDNRDNVVKKNEKEGHLSNDTQPDGESKPPLVIQIQKDKGLTKQDVIAIAGVIISAILFIITLQTFQQTKRSVDISERANNEVVYIDSMNRIKDSVLQIPFVQITDITVSDSIKDNFLVKFNILNFSNSPCKILYDIHKEGITAAENYDIALFNKPKTQYINAFLSNGSQTQGESMTPMRDSLFNFYKTGKSAIIIDDTIVVKSLLTNKKYEFIQVHRMKKIKVPPYHAVEILQNDLRGID